MMESFAEGIKLAEASGLSAEDLLAVLANGAMANPMFALKGPAMLKDEYPTAFPLKHQLKDMRFAMELAKETGTRVPAAAAATERLKRPWMRSLEMRTFPLLASRCLRPPSQPQIMGNVSFDSSRGYTVACGISRCGKGFRRPPVVALATPEASGDTTDLEQHLHELLSIKSVLEEDNMALSRKLDAVTNELHQRDDQIELVFKEQNEMLFRLEQAYEDIEYLSVRMNR
eukprot:jgi/Picre1/31143/NNA_006497.t1